MLLLFRKVSKKRAGAPEKRPHTLQETTHIEYYTILFFFSSSSAWFFLLFLLLCRYSSLLFKFKKNSIK